MGKSQTKAKNKYNAKAYDRISVTVKKGMKDEWKSEAEKKGLSLNAFIEKAVNQMMTSDNCTNYSCETSDSDTEILNSRFKIEEKNNENASIVQNLIDNGFLSSEDGVQYFLGADGFICFARLTQKAKAFDEYNLSILHNKSKRFMKKSKEVTEIRRVIREEERKIRTEKRKQSESKAYAAHNYHMKYNRTKSSNNRRVNRYKF